MCWRRDKRRALNRIQACLARERRALILYQSSLIWFRVNEQPNGDFGWDMNDPEVDNNFNEFQQRKEELEQAKDATNDAIDEFDRLARVYNKDTYAERGLPGRASNALAV